MNLSFPLTKCEKKIGYSLFNFIGYFNKYLKINSFTLLQKLKDGGL